MKSALIYFSNTGNTKEIADQIEKTFDPDVIELTLEKPYGGFISSVGRYIGEHISKKKTQIKQNPQDFSDYDVVFLGSPVWAGTLPNFLQDYLKESNLTGTTVVPFITASGTGKEATLKTIEDILPDSEIKNYFFKSMREKNDVDAWLNYLKKDFNGIDS